MDCPACNNVLTEKKVDDIDVDVCEGGCGGVWLENWELDEIDEKHESAGKALLELDRNPEGEVKVEADRSCPECDNAIMIQRFHSVKKKAEIDECPSCGGTWLDLGELNKIRTAFATEEEQRKAAKKFLEEEFGSRFEKLKQETRKNTKQSRDFANMFRWICPSGWIPGDQDWGTH